MFETIRKVTRFIFWLDEREYLHKRRHPSDPGGRSSCWGMAPAGPMIRISILTAPLLFLSTPELYHEAIKLAEKLREQQREAEELKKLVKELEALERQLRALQEHCERVKREAKEREEREREEREAAETKSEEA